MNESTDGIYEEALSPLAVRHMPTGMDGKYVGIIISQSADDVNTSEDVDDDRLLLAAGMIQLVFAQSNVRNGTNASSKESGKGRTHC